MKVTLFVTFLHIWLVIFLCYFQSNPPKNSPKQPVVVHTQFEAEIKTEIVEPEPQPEPPQPICVEEEPFVQEEPKEEPPRPPPKPVVIEKKPEPKPKPVVKETKPPPKPIVEPKKPAPKPVVEAKKPTPKPVVTKTPAPPPAPKTTTNQEQIAASVKEILKKLNQPATGKTSSTTSKPKDAQPALGKLATESLKFQASYEDELALYLKTCLVLPENEDVKIKLTLTREGKVQSFEIIKCSSERNKLYVQSEIAALTCPLFDSHFKGEKTHTFSITLKGH